MKIELITDTNPYESQTQYPEAIYAVESDKFDNSDVDKIVNSLDEWIRSQTDNTQIPVNFKIVVDGNVVAERNTILRGNDPSVVTAFVSQTMRARKVLRDA